MTEIYRSLRAAERFGLDPRVVQMQMEPAMRALVIGFDRLRREEEGRLEEARMRVMAGALGTGGGL